MKNHLPQAMSGVDDYDWRLGDFKSSQRWQNQMNKLRRSSRPDALLKSYGLPTWEELTKDDDSDEDDEDDDSEDEDDGGGGNSHYNPDEPRIPAGQPGGGQWTTAGNGASTDSGSLSVDDIRQALVDRFNNPSPQAQGVQVAQLTPPFIGPMIDAIGATGEGSVGNVGLPPSVGAIPTILNNDGNPAGDDSGKTQEENAADAKPLPKPEGIPDNWIEKPSADGKGTIYTNPENPNDTVRVMPPNPDSPYPSQQVPYVIDQNGGFRDVNGNPIPGAKPGDTPEAHIPYSQFKFRR